ncbi:MAG: tetratricopeptide repeat protein [Myxococcota bacterium]
MGHRLTEIEALFHAALEVPQEQRDELLKSLSGGDLDLYAETMALLDADTRCEASAENGPSGASSLSESHNTARAGRFVLEKKIAEGGGSTVYLGRDGKDVAAIKRLKRENSSPEAVARFYLEQEILSGLDHPGIAQLIESGVSAQGIPFFALEYICGEPITRHCERLELSIRRRLELFVSVCEAVAAAHEQQVAHCDIKPSHVLVDSSGTTKLIDFGIAQPPAGEPSAPQAWSNSGPRMTLRYASPEQVSGGSVGIATDVYALGLILFELVSGELPYELDLADVEQTRDAIQDTPPRSLCRVLRSRRRRFPRGQYPPHIARLERIATKALRKNPTHRYRNANELRVDMQRYLHGRPVQAPRVVPWRRDGSETLRRRALAASLLAVGLAAVGVAAFYVASLSSRDPEPQERQADFLKEVLSGSFSDAVARGDPAEGRRMLDRAENSLRTHLADHPRTQAVMLHRLAAMHNRTGGYRDALRLAGEALELLRSMESAPAESLAATHCELALAHLEVGELDEAEQQARQALRYGRAAGDPSCLADANQRLARILKYKQDDRASEFYEQALKLRRKVYGPEHEGVAETLSSFSGFLYDQGDYIRAEIHARESLEIRRLGGDPAAIAESLARLGVIGLLLGDYREAEDYFSESARFSVDAFGEEHPHVADARSAVGVAQMELGHYAQAAFTLRETLASRRRLRGLDSTATDNGLNHLARLNYLTANYDESQGLAWRALLQRLGRHGEDHTTVARSLTLIGQLDGARKEWMRSWTRLEQAISILREQRGELHALCSTAALSQARADVALGNEQQARFDLERSLKACRALHGMAHPSISDRLVFLAALLSRDEPGRAGRLLLEARRDRQLRFDAHDWRLAEVDTLRALLLYNSGGRDDASKLLEDAVGRFRKHLGEQHPRSIWAGDKLAYVRGNANASGLAILAF